MTVVSEVLGVVKSGFNLSFKRENGNKSGIKHEKSVLKVP